MAEGNPDNNSFVEGLHYETLEPVRLKLIDGRIHAIENIGREDSGNLHIIAPGLTDLQINGFRGVDFNSPELSAEQIEVASRKILGSGVTGYYPTLVTASPDKIGRNLETLLSAIEKTGLASFMIKGIHLEGPFISPEDGPRGAHRTEFCRLPDPDLLKDWIGKSGGHIKILTLAPELPGCMNIIKLAVREGIKVSLGHTAADPEIIREAVDAGATFSTHLGNGAHRILPRHPNYIWEQLSNDGLYTTMIADGFHLPDSVLKVFAMVKKEKGILVSDGMPFTGMNPGIYQSEITGGVVLTEKGKLHLQDQPDILAGSASTLLDGVHKMSSIISFPEAWNMASRNPIFAMLNEQSYGISTDSPANLISIEKVNSGIEVKDIWLDGQKMQ